MLGGAQMALSHALGAVIGIDEGRIEHGHHDNRNLRASPIPSHAMSRGRIAIFGTG